MIGEARRAGRRLFVAESYVFTATHREARRLVEAGEIGEPLQVRQTKGLWVTRPEVERSERGLEQEARTPWRRDPSLSGGGPFPWFMDHAVHFFATARFLTLGAEVDTVLASTTTLPTGEREIFSVAWTFSRPGMTGVWHRADQALGVFEPWGFYTLVHGTEGSLLVLGEGGGHGLAGTAPAPITLFRRGRTVQVDVPSGPDDRWLSRVNYYNEAHARELDHFLRCLLGEADPGYTGEDGRKDVQATLASIMSALEGRSVRLSEVPPDWTAYGARA